nr:immunoglobulin heavy chain junction region [Mus musculus]NSM05638.1 immunoglobulin heavy chain junction region [Mus musculus]NSM06993.1 immunoglobulin heavy chain junction region [Mus musculus]NSM07891.1 immunoglobulin heavy chain junction region [Mus musculus]
CANYYGSSYFDYW